MNIFKRLADWSLRQYDRLVLDRPLIVILGLVIIIGGLAYKAKDFKIDASAETLLLESDADLRYSREINNTG